ncbi:LOW QUALITY PROTEIN: Hypothetical protein PHPALM_37885 [Phytophthora palmivora]|uniref:Uncharacterized protein n=1 Tax=Phytophthora palmivora TaxID=4796 RepID=A0A2P4WWA7_9STRA|nr:LOW QUALITY PROTEIN: Hypothetical protein PHPALM_37885 [Phytophthora palmivora]
MKALGIDVERMIEHLAGSLVHEEKDEFLVGDELVTTNVGEDSVLNQLVDGTGCGHWYMDMVTYCVLGNDPPAFVESLKATLADDAVPFRCKPRRYASLQSAFLREYTAELEKRDHQEESCC